MTKEDVMRSTLTAATLACGVIAVMHAAAPDPIVTPVAGPSWLHRLGVDYRDTSLGRGAGRYGPDPSGLAATRPPMSVTSTAPVTVSGADLYRLNCQACHRAEGTGAPPEIKSVLPAVQGTTLQQMRGTVTKEDLYARIEKGGQRMPAREHLQRTDIDVLYGYLTRLANTKNTKDTKNPKVTKETISADRLGENVVKGTCHICHDAIGARPSEKAMLDGAIPSLASLMTTTAISDFVNKVERGAPAVMGALPAPHRGRMPVFYYLTDNEIAAAYRYLHAYPPRP
jgi:mono/diheme cytochrome c family protein